MGGLIFLCFELELGLVLMAGTGRQGKMECNLLFAAYHAPDGSRTSIGWSDFCEHTNLVFVHLLNLVVKGTAFGSS